MVRKKMYLLTLAAAATLVCFMNCSGKGNGSAENSSSQSVPVIPNANSSVESVLALAAPSATVGLTASLQIQASGGVPPYFYDVLPQFMGTIDQNGAFKAPNQSGIATVKVTDSSGNAVTETINVDPAAPYAQVLTLPPNTITDLVVTGINQHAFSGVGCPSGYNATGSMADSGGPTDGTYTFGRIEFCALQPPTATQVVVDIQVTPPNQSCPTGYTVAQTSPANEAFADCPIGTPAFHAPCGNPQLVCLLTGSLVLATQVVTSFYVTDNGQPCNGGDVAVGQTNSIDSGPVIGYSISFCETLTKIPR